MKSAVIRMYGGKLVDVLNVRPEDIEPRVFVHALSCIGRYTGHCKRPYSVAEHSIKLADWLEKSGAHPDMIRAALIHDWSEALFNDLASPLKKNFASYQRYEKAAQKVIFKRMRVPWEAEVELKQFDTAIRVDEKAFFWDNPEMPEYDPASDIYEGFIPTKMGIVFEDTVDWKVIRELFAVWISKYFRGIEGV